MKRYIIVGILVFCGFAVSFAPAGIMDRAFDQVAGVDLADTQGTLWSGQADLIVQQQRIGKLHWSFVAWSILVLRPAYEWHIEETALTLNAQTASGFTEADVSLDGNLEASAVAPWLQPYDIQIGGTFDIKPSAATLRLNTQVPDITALDGQLHWSGGAVRYRLSGVRHEALLPPMVAYLQLNEQAQPEAVVYGQDENTPLLLASLGAEGFVKIGITKLFTKVLRTPWPGSDPDHAVVLEVEEQVF